MYTIATVTQSFSNKTVDGGLAAMRDRAFPSRARQQSTRNRSAINSLKPSLFMLSLGALSACTTSTTTSTPDDGELRTDTTRTNEVILVIDDKTPIGRRTVDVGDYFLGEGVLDRVSWTQIWDRDADLSFRNEVDVDFDFTRTGTQLVVTGFTPSSAVPDLPRDTMLTISFTVFEGDLQATQQLRILFRDTDGGAGSGADDEDDDNPYAEPKTAEDFIDDSAPVLVIAGTADEGERLEGSERDDRIGSIGSGDVALGGGGDDWLSIEAVDFERLDGGTGTDTLAFEGSGMSLDLSVPDAPRVENIEIIDLTGSGDNTLTLSELAVRALTESNQVTLTIHGDDGDQLALKEGIGAGAGQWQANADGTLYTLNDAVLAVDAAIEVVEVA